jgi:hypothetical protein
MPGREEGRCWGKRSGRRKGGMGMGKAVVWRDRDRDRKRMICDDEMGIANVKAGVKSVRGCREADELVVKRM